MIFREEDVGGRERVTTDEERVARGAGQRFSNFLRGESVSIPS